MDPVDLLKLCMDYPKFINSLVKGLKMCSNQRIMNTILDSIYRMCKLDAEYPNDFGFRWMIENADGVEMLQEAEKHPNRQISELSEEIRTKYFD